jgi:hypothetical protein
MNTITMENPENIDLIKTTIGRERGRSQRNRGCFELSCSTRRIMQAVLDNRRSALQYPVWCNFWHLTKKEYNKLMYSAVYYRG